MWAAAISVFLVSITVLVQREAFRWIFRLAPDSSGPEDATRRDSGRGRNNNA